jgi:hypothetical protein
MSAEHNRVEASAILGRGEMGSLDDPEEFNLGWLVPMLSLHSGGLDNSEMFNLPGREREKNLRCMRGGRGIILDVQR